MLHRGWSLLLVVASACASGGTAQDAAAPDRIIIPLPDASAIDAQLDPPIDAARPDAFVPPVDAPPPPPPDGAVAAADARPIDASLPPACDVPATFGAVGTLGGGAYSQGISPNNVIFLQATLDGTTMPDVLSLELYNGYGPFTGGAIVTGTYTLSGVELNYATCGVCLLVHANADPMTGAITQSYMATGGTVDVTSVSGNLTGTITGATFEHVTIDPMTYVSTPVGDGCTSAIDSASFDLPITAL